MNAGPEKVAARVFSQTVSGYIKVPLAGYKFIGRAKNPILEKVSQSKLSNPQAEIANHTLSDYLSSIILF